MNKNSFRVVPSKIKRFVPFLGASLPCAEVTSDHWWKWVRWLKREVAAGRMAHTTAKVNINRAREFVRWLVANGKAHVEGMNKSAEAALA